ncbi:MAG TPA: hypothetical protein VIO38_02780, partial [Rariglobus sp.]
MKSLLVTTKNSPLARLAPALLAFAAPSVFAQTTYTWTSLAAGNWSDSTKWDANGVPATANNSTIQFYAGTSGTQNTVASSFNATHNLGNSFDLQTMILNGTAATTARTITINQSSSSLDFTGTDNRITNSAAGVLSYTVGSGINFSNGLQVDGASTNTLTLSGAITGSGGFIKNGN